MFRHQQTTFITIGCLSALVALGLSKLIQPHFWWLIPPVSLIFTKRRNIIYLVAAIIVGASLGFWRGGIYQAKVHQIQKLNNHKVTLEIVATQDAIYGSHQQLDFTAKTKTLAGTFKISGFGLPMVYRGDHLRASGKLHAATGSYQGFIGFAKLELVAHNDNLINRLTRRISAGMQTALPEPNASFGLGLLVGQRNNLPVELYQQLIMVGLVHIVAVSGYNLTILVRAASRLKLFSKYQQLILSLTLIAVFLLMTGFAASIVRAAIVSTLSLWAWFYGRRFRPVLLITFTAALTALINPLYIWGDLGWYLSFLAFSGILIISPILSQRLFGKSPKFLLATAIETFCAELMALPFIMLMFGQLSLIGLVANVLIVPLVPLAMLLSAIAALAGASMPSIAGWLAAPANWLLTYMLDLVRWFSSLPGIFQKRSIGIVSLLVFYSLLGFILMTLHKFSTKNYTE